MPDTIWLTPFLRVVRPEDGSVLRYSPEAVQDVLDFFSLLCFGQNEWAGKPFVLLPWEEQAIRQFYGVQVRDEDGTWVRYRRFLYDEIPKKNGKSEFAAGLGLYHLLFDGEERPQVGVFAADKNNADIIYQCAKYMVEHTCLGQPEGDPIAWARDSRREIHTKYGGVLKVYSSDADSKHGYSFSAILIDELHAQPNRRLWDVLTVGSDAARRQQAVIVLTTAGDDPDRKSIGWEIHEKCRRILAWRKGEPERELDEDDPQWCPIMYGISVLTQDDPDRIVELDIFDEALWRECNPSYGVTISPRKFRSDARAARQSEAAERNFRWLRLNQWIATKDVGWMPLTLYDKTQWTRPEWRPLSAPARRQAARDVLEGKTCYGGLDLSTTTDLTALTLIFPPQEGLDTWTTLFWAWRPEDGVLEAEQRDHVPYRDWGRAGFLEPGGHGGLHHGGGHSGLVRGAFPLGHPGCGPLPLPHPDPAPDGAGGERGGDPTDHDEYVPGHEGAGAAHPRPPDAPRTQHLRPVLLRQRPVRGGRKREPEAHEEPEHRAHRHGGGLDHRNGRGNPAYAGRPRHQRTHFIRGLGNLT